MVGRVSSVMILFLDRSSYILHPCRKNLALSEVTKYQTAMVQKPIPFFQVVYNKHTLTLDDLSTLADQNWLNDQVTI